MNVEFHGKTKLITFESKTYDLDVIGVLLMDGRGLIVRGSHVIIGLTNPYFYVMFSLVQQSSINAYAPPTHTQKKKKKKTSCWKEQYTIPLVTKACLCLPIWAGNQLPGIQSPLFQLQH